MLKEIENEAWKVLVQKRQSFAESPRPLLGPDFLNWPLPDPKSRSMGTRFLTPIQLNLSWKRVLLSGTAQASPGAARIVTSTKLGNRPIGPTAPVAKMRECGEDEAYGIELEVSVW